MTCHDCGKALSFSEATNLGSFCIECDNKPVPFEWILPVMCFAPALLWIAYLVARLVTQ